MAQNKNFITNAAQSCQKIGQWRTELRKLAVFNKKKQNILMF